MEFYYKFHSEIKVLPIDPVFSNWVDFNTKSPYHPYHKTYHHKLFYKFKELFGHFFFFEIQQLKALEKPSQFPCVHYSFPIVSWLCYCNKNNSHVAILEPKATSANCRRSESTPCEYLKGPATSNRAEENPLRQTGIPVGV